MDVTPATFDAEVLQSKIPVLVDFWASWCAPCRVLGPQVDRIAKENEGFLKVVKLDSGSHMDFTRDQGIESLPTLLIFIEGKEVSRKVGAAGGYAALVHLIAPHLPPKA